MKYFSILLMLVSICVTAQEQHKIPVTQVVQVCTDKTNVGGAAVGAGVGYVGGRVLGGMFGISRGTSGLVGAAAGGIVGANTAQEKTCHPEDKIIGYKVLTAKDGKLIETYEPVTQ